MNECCQYKPVCLQLRLLLSGCYTGAELQEIRRQVERLSDPSSPESVGRLLQLRRQVLLLQFDTAVRHLVRSVSCT